MKEIRLPPRAPALLASLRAIGYSFDSALADIVDNSVAAAASAVDIQFRVSPDLYVAVIDDGTGMSPAGLVAAMQHGGVGPGAEREATDLGRFGLGLKTASFSQCRRLSVATLRDGELGAAIWSLDRIDETGDFTLGIPEGSELEAIPHVADLAKHGHGTVVVWQEFDRALAGESVPSEALTRLMDKSRDHLGLVFHRFLKGEPGLSRLDIRMNGLEIRGTDPFLAGVSTELPSTVLTVEDRQITFTPFILPHRSRLSKRQLAEIDGEDGLRRTQGFYVYRNRRLITSGTWFRLLRQEELTKLARVRVDIPNALDHLWHLDVKKSTATPPQQVRAGLLQVIERIGDTSKRVFTHRGWKQKGPIARLWDRLELPTGVNYRINRGHPAAAAASRSMSDESRGDLTRLLEAVEMTIPFDAIYADMAAERDLSPQFSAVEAETHLRSLLGSITAALAAHPDALAQALRQVPNMEPFTKYPDVTRRLLREVQGG